MKRVALLLSNLRQTIKLAFGVSRALVLAYLGAQVLDALLPIALAYVGKRIVDAVVIGAASPVHDVRPALVWVLVELALFVGKHGSYQLAGYLSSQLRSRLATHVDVLIFQKALGLSLSHFEDPAFMNMLDRARKQSGWRPVEIITHGFSLARDAITLIGLAALLLPLSPFAVVALGLASLPFLAEMKYAGEEFAIHVGRTQEERQAGYLQSLLTSDWYAKEVKLFSLGPMLIERYRKYQERFTEEDRRFAARRGLAVALLGGASALIFYAVYASIVARAVMATLTLGEMTLCLAAFRQAQGSFESMMTTISRTYEDNLYIANLFEYLALPDDDRAAPAFLPAGEAPSLDVEHVGYTYPDAAKAALEDVSFHVAAGETIALVGPNGAGKTTLVKLLTALCRPSSGRIQVGGEDIAKIETGALRSRIGVVFQDAAEYNFTAGENIGLGWLPDAGDEARVEQAARDGGVEDLIGRLPEKYKTMLGRWFGGVGLSGGEWQRLALARAFMRRSEILILDEPTSAIDAEGEHQLFERFQTLKAGRTAILITHRFSTVRMADRIVVIDGGKVVEEGKHAELLAKDGLYARMFRLQAARYELGENAA